MILNFVCHSDGSKTLRLTVRAAHPFLSRNREYRKRNKEIREIDEKTSRMRDFGEKGVGTRDQDPHSNLSTHFTCAWETTWGLLLGILGGGVPPNSPNPDPISGQKKSFFHTRPLRNYVIVT